MRAELLLHQRLAIGERSFAALRIWQVPAPVRASRHRFKYSLAYIEEGNCIVRFDNEAGKGDHKHVGAAETAYEFVTLDRLVDDFWMEVDRWRERWGR